MISFKQYIEETTIKRGLMKQVDPYYGGTQARGGRRNPTVFGVDHKKDTVWFTKKKDAQLFIDWKGRRDWDGNADLDGSMMRDDVHITGKIVSGH